MPTPNIRWRVGVTVAAAGLAAGAAVFASPLVSSATTEPPPPTEPDGSAPAPGGDREAIVEQIVTVGADNGFPYDAECVAGIVEQVPDEELAAVAVIVTQAVPVPPGSESMEHDDSASTEASEPGGTLPREEAAAPVAPETTSAEAESEVTMVAETLPTVGSLPELSPETEALGEDLVYCLSGDADPALVDEALDAVSEEAEAEGFDLECMGAVMTTFEDETLQQIIDNAAGGGSTEVADSDAVDDTATGEDLVVGTIPGLDVTIPEIPEISMPDLSIPEISMPDISTPEIDVSLPEIDVPSLDALEGVDDAYLLLACGSDMDEATDTAAATEASAVPVETLPVTETTG